VGADGLLEPFSNGCRPVHAATRPGSSLSICERLSSGASGSGTGKDKTSTEKAANTPSDRRRLPRGVSVWVGVLGVVGASAIGALLTLGRSDSERPSVPTTPPAVVDAAALPGLQTKAPPWPPDNGDLDARLRVLGLPALSRYGTRLHTHQHLDVFVDGQRVTVPAGIGINPPKHLISPLHTHDTSGLIHVESPTSRSFSLAQFFGVWGVRLTKRCLGGECGSGKLHVFVNGKRAGDPNLVLLAPHQQIVVAFGLSPKPVPASYSFPAGK
jgi:hypothetical protein